MARTGRGRRSALALVLAALSLAVPAHAAPVSCPVEGAVRTGPDGWTRIAGPVFPAGGDTMTSYAVDEMRPERLFATNGVGISSSRDGGCTWIGATLPEEELSALTPLGGESGGVSQRKLLDVTLPFVAASTVWAYGITDVAVGGGTPMAQPRVLLSADGGRSFALANGTTAPLPRFGRPVALRTAASPLEAFLLMDESVPVETRSLFRTTNGGVEWTRLPALPAEFTDVAVDFFRGVLWAWNDSGLFQTADNGVTWVQIGTPAPPVRVDVATLFTTIVLQNGARLDFVGARRVLMLPAPDLVTSVTAGPELGMVATSSVTDGVQLDPPLRIQNRKPIDVTPEDVTLSDLNLGQSKLDDKYVLYGFSPRALYRRAIPDDFDIPPPPIPVVVLEKAVPPPPKKPFLRPAGGIVTLKPGEARKVTYDLVLPPTPTPLDVFFMTDSTGSMRDAIGAVQEGVQDIVDDLSAAGIDLHFGVADFRDYPQQPNDSATYPYKRHRAVGPIDDDLADALAGITTGGGSSDGDDSALEAIYQAVTGAGRDGLTADIPAGQGAEFRKDSLKVVLVASDDEMRDPGPAAPYNAGPTKDTVIDALNDNGVEIVGIRVKTSSADPRPEMEELAKGAGSVATAGGVDCDGDEEPDIDEGEPLVCDFSSSDDSIAPAFINMLRGIKDLADVNVGVKGPRDVVRHLGEGTFEAVNVKAFNTLPVPVQFRCTEAYFGTDTPVTISGTLRGKTLVTATATVRCLAPPPDVQIPPVIPKPPPRPLRAAAVPPPPPPQPNPNVNPNPNPNPQAQGNAGFASQEEQQSELALAENDITPGNDEELAFSMLDQRTDVTPAVTLVAGMVIACAAAGTQLQLARRTRVASNPSRGARP